MGEFARIIHQQTAQYNYMGLAVYEHGPKSKGQGEIASGLNAGVSSMLTKPAANQVCDGVGCSVALLIITSTVFHFFLCFPWVLVTGTVHFPHKYSQHPSELHSDG